jgi:hypothetical protein
MVTQCVSDQVVNTVIRQSAAPRASDQADPVRNRLLITFGFSHHFGHR